LKGFIFVTEEEYEEELKRIEELEEELRGVSARIEELRVRVTEEEGRLRGKYPVRVRVFRAWDAARFRVYYYERRIRELGELRRGLAYWANRLIREARVLRVTEPTTAREYASIWSETFRYIRERVIPALRSAEARLTENREALARLRRELESIRDSIYREREALRSLREELARARGEAERLEGELGRERERLKWKRIIVRIIYVDAYISRERTGYAGRILKTPTKEHFRITKAFEWYWYPRREPLPAEVVEEMRELFIRQFPFLFWIEYMPYRRVDRAYEDRCLLDEIKVGATSVDEVVDRDWFLEVCVVGRRTGRRQLPIVGVFYAEGKKKNIPYMGWIRYERLSARDVDPGVVSYEEGLRSWWEVRNDRARIPDVDRLIGIGQVGRRMRYDEALFFNTIGMFDHRMEWLKRHGFI